MNRYHKLSMTALYHGWLALDGYDRFQLPGFICNRIREYLKRHLRNFAAYNNSFFDLVYTIYHH